MDFFIRFLLCYLKKIYDNTINEVLLAARKSAAINCELMINDSSQSFLCFIAKKKNKLMIVSQMTVNNF